MKIELPPALCAANKVPVRRRTLEIGGTFGGTPAQPGGLRGHSVFEIWSRRPDSNRPAVYKSGGN
jgi:hypothetical protein